MTRRRLLGEGLKLSAALGTSLLLFAGCGGGEQTGTTVERTPDQAAKDAEIEKQTAEAFKQQQAAAKKKK
jgi:hypothetical protein